jgi:subtilisin-like proprotein convertase family protein
MEKLFSKIARLRVAGVLICLWTTIASAQTNYSFAFPVNLTVPDGNASGLALQADLAGMDGIIAKLTLSLNISGGYNGDLYATLVGPNGGFAVLLNRVGITTGHAFGYSNTGFDVTFDDTADHDNIHLYQNLSYDLNGGGQLTGTWASDGRFIDPLSDPAVFDATQPSLSLDSFNGTDPNGSWTLFIADVSGGGQSTVVNWGLRIETVPEPSMCALLGIGFAFLLARKRMM